MFKAFYNNHMASIFYTENMYHNNIIITKILSIVHFIVK